MALEMVDDPQDKRDYNENANTGGGRRGGSGGGGGGGILNLLPLLFTLFRGGGGKGGILILLLVVGGGYFLMRNGGCAGGNGAGITDVISQFSRGGNLNADSFRKASVYEGLVDDNTKNPLPEAVSLARFAPARQNQGEQGSCVAWSAAYAARTIIESASTNTDPNQVA
ncbi:MAG TPA: peptidase C1A papain, partial [Ferruginibacter sp.]|nr:peptidase C1A papain [Ferruginibacter sp.]